MIFTFDHFLHKFKMTFDLIFAIGDKMLGKILSNTKRSGDCLIWCGGKFACGYGRIYYKGKSKRVHRLVMEILIGKEIESTTFVCHTCDTPLCCNPDHLFLGTPKENHVDAMVKGRLPNGEKINTCKLDRNKVVEILKRWKSSDRKHGMHSSLAREFKVTPQNIRQIVNRNTWKHISI